MITPGLSRACGSKSVFTRRMSRHAFSPHSSSTNGAMLRPVPCSALSEPSYFRATIWQTSSMKRAYRDTSSTSPKSGVKTKCRFPSSAWPKMIASS